MLLIYKATTKLQSLRIHVYIKSTSKKDLVGEYVIRLTMSFAYLSRLNYIREATDYIEDELKISNEVKNGRGTQLKKIQRRKVVV